MVVTLTLLELVLDSIYEAQMLYIEHFRKFVHWINDVFEFSLIDLLKKLGNEKKVDELEAIKELQVISAALSVGSNGIFSGCIGAIDGMAVRIQFPKNVPDSAIFLWNDFFALNMQAVYDRRKQLL